MAKSLWGAAFEIPDKKKEAKKVIEKTAKPKEIKVDTSSTAKVKIAKTKISTEEKLKMITSEVYRILGIYKDQTQVIHTREELHKYIDAAIANNIIAVDTETNNSLDPITCKLMGGCIYTPGEKNAYIPINHVDKDGNKLGNQLSEQDIYEEFSRLNNTYTIMHNGKFDYQVLKSTCGVCMRVDWDTVIGAKLLDENEFSAGLKQQYIEKIDSSIEKYSIEHLFEGMEYAIFDPDLFALYAATDSYMTYKLYMWQKERFNLPENKGIKYLAETIEMPLVEVVAEMEMNGMDIDQEYGSRLSVLYHNELNEIDDLITKELNKLIDKIAAWRLTPDANYHPPKKTGDGEGKSKAEQLTDPINIGSPTQLGILFYDILKAPVVNRQKPRAIGEEEIKAIADKMKLPLCDLILKRRELTKLISTYIDSIPELAKKWPDGRVRTKFHQYGAATGRFSSGGKIAFGPGDVVSGINFQNIPSHEKRIRLLFKAGSGNRIVGGDFSQQEPKLTAHYSQDENMIGAYKEGKDLYAIIASRSFGRPYEDCLEFYPEGTEIEVDGKKVICGNKTHQNKAGKERRSNAKSILLGVLYGRGAASVGEQIGKSYQEAQEIIDAFFKGFPKVKQWINESIESAHKLGYVEDVAGRRRRLPDAMLAPYDFVSDTSEFNPLLNCKNLVQSGNSELINKYSNLISKCRSNKDREKVKADAKLEGITIHDNGGYIAQAERQAVNSRVQGGAATLTKCALNMIYRDHRLRDINAKLVNTVHDEILLEVPIENSELAEKYLQEDMINSAKEYVPEVPMKCDTYNVPMWYFDEMAVAIKEELKKYIKGNPEKNIPPMEHDDAYNKLINSHPEFTLDQMKEFLAAD